MTLSEFKFIFYMEWAHRMLGRFIGLSFILPGAYFAYKGYMTRGIQRVSLVVATLIGMQGVLGWLMVKSGLSDELLAKPGAVPRVSHYWLTAHLGSAFIIYSIMVATGLRILRSNRKLDLSLFAPMFKSPSFKTFRASSHGVAGLVLLTALSGGLVAGLDAGLIYNEFPFMGNGIVPEDFWALSTQTDRNPHPISWFRNVLENPSAVQFNHRVLACTTFTAISALWVVSRRIPLVRPARIAINALLGVAVIQVTLGITTLLYLVPVPLAAAHQCGSLTLLTVALWLMHTLRVVPK
nr:Cytochrome c oxidase assembly protein cox15 [Polyrhizophydium stewartii]